MSGAGTAVLTALGVLLAGSALRDVFRTLWDPSGRGLLSRWVGRAVWRVACWRGGRGLDLAGPLAMALVVVTWAGAVILGFALVYLPWLSADGFVYGAGLDRGDRAAVVDALYLSSVLLSTLGLGDIVPSDGWLRLVAAAQALVGFTLLTASIAWITQVQQALVRRRSLARLLVALRRADLDDDHVEPTTGLLERVAHDLAGIQVDLSQSTTSYYFRERDPRAALAVALPWAAELARRGRDSHDPQVERAGAVLDVVVDDVVDTLRTAFLDLGAAGRDEVVEAYLADHRHERL